jgi:hypothetical protein
MAARKMHYSVLVLLPRPSIVSRPWRGGSKSQEDPNPFVYSMHITDSIWPLRGNDLSKGAICSLIQKFGTKKGEVDKTLFSSTNSINSQQLCIIQQLN